MMISVNRNNFITAATYMIVCVIIYVIFIPQIDINGADEITVFILSWIGNIIFFIYAYVYYKRHGKIFTPFMMVVLFMFLFDWGQCFMWSLGIHVDSEIGKAPLYGVFSGVSAGQIVSAQMYTIICCSFFLCGATYGLVFVKKNARSRMFAYDYKYDRIALFKISRILALVIIPLSLYQAVRTSMVSYLYGYVSIYYSEHNTTGVLTNIDYMFFPVLVGLLLGSDYDKWVRRFVYLVFILYAGIYFIGGKRGVWLGGFVMLLWMEHAYNKKINGKRFIKYVLLGIVGLYIVYVMIDIRGSVENLSQVTSNDIVEAFSLENNPLVSVFFETGGAMSIILILLTKQGKLWTGYNTFIAAILGMPSTVWLKWFGIDFMYLDNWFSQNVLGISWGTGFSVVAESYINGGLFFAPVYMIIIGFIISKITEMPDKELSKNSLLIAFKVISAQSFMFIFRGSVHGSMKRWFLGTILLLGFSKLLAYLYKCRHSD